VALDPKLTRSVPAFVSAKSRIGKYEIIEPIGAGGSGVVYRGFDTQLRRPVALKFLSSRLSSHPQGRERFLAEARAAAALDHANICTVYEIVEKDEATFIVMTLLEGMSLRQKIAAGPVPWHEALDVIVQAAAGLHAAHEAGIIHRDVKPENLFLTKQGIVKLVDFGLARVEEQTVSTLRSAIVGTLAYMSPEQARGRALNRRTDIWALAIVLYEMLTGKRPFRGDTSFDLLNAVVNDRPVSLVDVPGIPAGWGAIVSGALEKDPALRPATAFEFAELLRRTADVYSRPGQRLSGRDARQSGETEETPWSIAVLPFLNIGPDHEEYFSDGLTEELIHALSRIPQLRVVARRSAFEFKGKSLNVHEIGTRLKVKSLLEGSIRKAEGRLRINVQLINVEDGYEVWSERYDRQMKDIFAVQDEISESVANALKVTIANPPRKRAVPASSYVEAHNIYLKGRFFWNQQTEEGFRKAFANFEEALRLDPHHAPAHSGLADYYGFLGFWSLAPAHDVWVKARAAARQALELDETAAEPHISLAYVEMFYDWDHNAAERECLRALQLNPGSANAHYAYSICLLQSTRMQDSLASMRRAYELDPLSDLFAAGIAYIFYYARQYDRALEDFSALAGRSPRYFEAHLGTGLAFQQKHRYGDAIESFEKAVSLSGEGPLVVAGLGSCYAEAGMAADAKRILQRLDDMSQVKYVSPVCWALVYTSMGEKELAFKWLEAAREARATLVCYLHLLPVFDCLRGDDRFQRLLEKVVSSSNVSTLDGTGPEQSMGPDDRKVGA
jgi:eukaryotic-like serine/threonine-protein kinase